MLVKEQVEGFRALDGAVAAKHFDLWWTVREELYFPALARQRHLHHDRALSHRGQRVVNSSFF